MMHIVPPYTPELLVDAQRLFDHYLEQFPETKVIEWGAGWSTIWLAQLLRPRNGHLVSIEHDKGWYTEVAKVLKSLGMKNEVDLRLVEPSQFHRQMWEFPTKFFNIAYIDCIDEQRPACIYTAAHRLSTGGILVIDDTHWVMLKPLVESLVAHGGYELCGVVLGQHTRKTGEVCDHHTTFIRKK